MVNLETIRKDMDARLKLDYEIKSVEVHADTLEEALADAAVQLDTKVSNLEYEVVERGFAGIFGIAAKPWTLIVYQNLETVEKIAREREKKTIEIDGLDEEDLQEVKDGEFFVRRFGVDILLKVTLPVGGGNTVNVKDILSELNRGDTKSFDEKLVKKLAEDGSEGKYEIVGVYNHVPANDSIFVVDISSDEMKATCSITPPKFGGADISADRIERALKNQGVVAGISMEKIEALVDRPVYNTDVVVAEGVEAVNGRDAYIAYNFETDRSKLRAKEAANGQVDFKELNLIQNVLKGQTLAQKMLPERGKSGKTLFGKYLEARDGRDINLPLGKNVAVESDGRTIVSEINGQVLLVNGKINVEPIMEVDGVNNKTGNITFLGSVIVKGNVEDGFDIKADGNIDISGSVGKCRLESKGDIMVTQGIIGRDGCEIVCGGSLWSKFIQNAEVSAEEDIVVFDSIMNSTISAQRRIILQGKRAQIVGGHLFATEAILARNIGSSGGTETILEVGVDPRAKARLTELIDMQSKNVKELEDKELDISTLENQKKIRKTLPKDKADLLQKLLDRKREIVKENTAFNTEITSIQAHLRELRNIGKIYASGTVYAGVKIFVRDEKDEVRVDVKSVTFYYEEGFVRRGKYEQPKFKDLKNSSNII